MRKVTLIRGARQLLTLRGPSGPRRGADLTNLGIIQDGAVLVADGVICEVGPSRRLENLALARGAEEIDASGRVVMPGFVDAHMQVLGALPALSRPIHEISPRALEAQAQRVIEEAIRNGTTAIEAKSGAVEAKSGPEPTEAGELKILKVHAALRELPLTMVSTFVSNRGPGDFSERLLPVVRRRKLAEFAEIRWESQVFAPAEACRYLMLARELGLGVKLNASLSGNSNAIAAAAGMGATSISHVTEPTECDALLLARSGIITVLAPAVMFYRGIESNGSARRLIDHGAAVALASGDCSCDYHSQSMQMAIGLAYRTMHMTPAEAIAASTINAAHAIRRGASVGSLESGKSADLLMLSVSDYRELPYHLGVNLVDLVMSRGEVLVERSQVKWPAR